MSDSKFINKLANEISKEKTKKKPYLLEIYNENCGDLICEYDYDRDVFNLQGLSNFNSFKAN